MTPSRHRVIIRAEAEADITEAAISYEQRQRGLGNEFVVEVEAAIARAAENPFHYACLRRKPEVRRVLTERFPYRVFFVRRERDIVVFRVLHGARDQRQWKSRVPTE